MNLELITLPKCKFVVGHDSREFSGYFIGIGNGRSAQVAVEEKTLVEIGRYLLATDDLVTVPARRADGLFDFKDHPVKLTELYTSGAQSAKLLNELLARA